MGKFFGLFFVLLGLIGVGVATNRSLGQVMMNNFCNGTFCLACGGCSDGTFNGNAGCWVWTGGPICSCNLQNGSQCNPTQVQVLCVDTFYLGGSCSGFNYYPNQCCANSGVPIKQQQTKPWSCVP